METTVLFIDYDEGAEWEDIKRAIVEHDTPKHFGPRLRAPGQDRRGRVFWLMLTALVLAVALALYVIATQASRERALAAREAAWWNAVADQTAEIALAETAREALENRGEEMTVAEIRLRLYNQGWALLPADDPMLECMKEYVDADGTD